MILKKHAMALALCGLFTIQLGCDEIAETTEALIELVENSENGQVCLDDFLNVFGLSRDELGATADEQLEELITAQEEVLGRTLIIDCVARDQPIEVEVVPPDYCEVFEQDCSGNGICESADGSCECDEGYVGPDCSLCAEGFERLESGDCAESACAVEGDICEPGGRCVDVDGGDTWNLSCECDEGYTGELCEECADGFGSVESGCAAFACAEDSCSGNGTCSDVEADGAFTVSCACDEGFTGDDCGALAEGYVELSDGSAVLDPCAAEDCSGNGVCSWNEVPGEGDAAATAVAMCACTLGYAGDQCEACDEANLFFDDEAEGLNCLLSECPESCRASETGSCDDENPENNLCVCDEGYAGIDCSECAAGYAALADGACAALACNAESCNGNGVCTDAEAEGAWAVSCACAEGYIGDACEACAEGYVANADGACIFDSCTAAEGEPSPACSGNGTCEWDAEAGAPGACACEGNFAGDDCGQCAEAYSGDDCATCAIGYFQLDDGSCVENPCRSDSCNGVGNCSLDTATGGTSCMCAVGFAGDDCGECAEGFEGAAPDCSRAVPPAGGELERSSCDDLSVLDECLGEELGDDEGRAGAETIFLFDATGSMRDDQARLSEGFSDLVASVRSEEGSLAIAWFKDNQRCDEPDWFGLNEGGLLSLSGDDADANETTLRDFMAGIEVRGGCDRPESLWDGVYEAVSRVTWSSTVSRSVVVLTDAPFHGDDKSEHSQAEIGVLLGEQGVNVTIVNVALSF